MSKVLKKMSDNAIKPDTYMGLSQQYIKDEISDEEFAKRCNRLKRIPINAYMSISEKFMQGEISEMNLWNSITD